MKNIAILSIILMASTLFSATNEEIIAHFKSRIPVPNLKIKVVSRKSVSDTLDYVSLFLTNGEDSQKISVFTSAEYIFPDVIDIKSGISLRDKMKREQTNKNISKVYKKEAKKNIISLGNDPKKETLVIFSDPECPFCKKELSKIESELKKVNIKMLFTPVHDKSSLEKSALIYKYTKNAKNDSEKIKVLRKYFNQEIDEKVSSKEVQRIDRLRQKYFKAGINGTPYKVMEKDITQ